MYGLRSVGSAGSMEALARTSFLLLRQGKQHDRNTFGAFSFRGLLIKQMYLEHTRIIEQLHPVSAPAAMET